MVKYKKMYTKKRFGFLLRKIRAEIICYTMQFEYTPYLVHACR